MKRSSAAAVCLASVAQILVVSCHHEAATLHRPADPGFPAPVVRLDDANGRSRIVARAGGPGPLLLSFVQVPQTRRSLLRDPNRSQIVFLSSMVRQYGARGLHLRIVALPAAGAPADTAALRNVAVDWNAGGAVVLFDPGRRAAACFDVRRLPTTFLITPGATIAERWEGFVPAYELVPAIESALAAGGAG